MTTTTTKHRLPAESLIALRHQADQALRLYSIVPDTFTEAFSQIAARLLAAAGARDIRTVAALQSNAEQVIQDAAGTGADGKWTKTTQRAVLHQHRNVLLTIVVAAYLQAPQRLSTREQPNPVALIPAVEERPRTAEPDRALTDDEIALARAWAMVSSRYQQKRYAAATYTLCDAGMRLAETALVRRSDFDGDEPEMVLAGGTLRRGARFLPLEAFHRSVLSTVADFSSTETADDLLLHRTRGGKDEHNAGTAAATRAMTSFLAALGLAHGDIVPASAARWRIQRSLDTQGLDAAVAVAGTTRAAVESELGITRALKEHKPLTAPRASVCAM